MRPRRFHCFVLISFLLFFLSAAFGQDKGGWVGSWATSQQVPEPRNALADGDLQDATLRQIVHLSLGGPTLRVKVSNRYGVAPLHLGAVHIAKPVSPSTSAIVAGSDKALTFGGKQDVTIPAGADYLSDPIAYPVPPFADLTITMYMEAQPTQQTGHPGSRATTYLVHGDHVADAEMANAKTVEHWYFIAGVDVPATPGAAAIVALGDSITDGHGVTTNGNDRWTDVLARRLQAHAGTKSISVLNHGIGGNRILLDSLGPNAMARFNNDVLAQPGVKWLIVFEAINDIGTFGRGPDTKRGEPVQLTKEQHETLVHNILLGYQQMIDRAHDHGIRVIGATITPFGGSFYYKGNPGGEADRKAINEWIRTPGHFDGLIDFDKAIRDPENPEQMLPKYDGGDHLHPNVVGYAAMADAIPLALFGSEAAKGAPKIAFTFDDLPAHSAVPPGETRLEVAQKILSAVHEAGMPPVYGFVNGAWLDGHPDDVSVLKAWAEAGNPLGNHTWSHMSLNQHSLVEFEGEITRNEAVLKQVSGDQDWHWFRYPFLAEGDTPEKRQAIRTFLGEHGYKIAAVTMSFGDYLWNEPYARCKAKGDADAVALLQKSYLSAADESIHWYRQLAQKVYGRDIPYVLLMHIGALDAEMLPQLLSLYKSRGFEFVTLPEAESDEAYKVSTDLSAAGPDSLEWMAKERNIPLPPRANTNPKFEEMCR